VDEDDAILRAALELINERGFGALTMDEVAVRAAVHPSALFSHWRSRTELVTALLRQHADLGPPPPDSGELEADLTTVLGRILDTVHRFRVLIATAMGEAARDPELARELRLFVYSWQTTARDLVVRAKERGALPPWLNEVWAADELASIVWFRILLVGELALPGVAERLATSILRTWRRE
jgi:AcrR family transcriptional regulator